MNYKDFIPPIFFKLYHGKPTPVKTYDSYEDALKECTGYENEELCNMVADKTVLFDHPLTNTFLLAGLLYSKPAVVLDFGGACGAHYFEMKKYIDVKWIVLETPQMVKSARSRGLDSGNLSFQDNFNNLPSVDFIYTSGALQYLPNPYEYLDKLLSLKPKFLMFNRMVMTHGEPFITVQKSRLSDNGNGPLPRGYTEKEITYPHTTLSYDQFVSKINYTLEWKVDGGIFYSS